MNYDARDIPQDDSLFFGRGEVKAKLYSVSKKQKAAAVDSEHFYDRKEEKPTNSYSCLPTICRRERKAVGLRNR